jgi:hypothetical protein
MDYVFWATGQHISSFVLLQNEIIFSSNRYDTKEEFLEAKEKKRGVVKFFSVPISKINFIKKEENSNQILINYKSFINLTIELVTDDDDDNELFFVVMENDFKFVKTIKTKTIFSAIKKQLLLLLATISLTAFTYYQSNSAKPSDIKLSSSAAEKQFELFMQKFGPFWIINLGALAVCYILFKIWQRAKNPVTELELIPTNLITK